MYIEDYILLLLCGAEAIQDIKTRTIHGTIWSVVAVIGAIWNIVGNETDILGLLLSALVGIFLMLCSKIMHGQIGIGDGIVFLAVGLWKGIEESSIILFYSLCLCCIWSLFLLILKKYSKTEEVPFLPFVFLGMIFHEISIHIY